MGRVLLHRRWRFWLGVAGVAAVVGIFVGPWRVLFPPRQYRLEKPSREPFHATGIAPPPVPYTFEAEGRSYKTLRLDPNQRYQNLNFPDLPQLVLKEGGLPPTRRFRRYSCTVNADGLRGPGEHPLQAPPDTFRIGVLGTGVTFGEGVEDDEVYTVLLEKALREDPPLSENFEVLNFGVPCMTMDNALGAFVYQRGRYDIDFWIVSLGVNDALPMFNRSLDAFRADARALVNAMGEAQVRAVVLVEPVNTFYPWMQLYPGYLEALLAEVQPHYPVFDLARLLDCHEGHDGLRLEVTGRTQRIVQYRGGVPEVQAEAEYQAAGTQQYMAPALYTYLDTHDLWMRTFITDVHLNPYGHHVVAEALRAWISAYLAERPAPVLDGETCGMRGG